MGRHGLTSPATINSLERATRAPCVIHLYMCARCKAAHDGRYRPFNAIGIYIRSTGPLSLPLFSEHTACYTLYVIMIITRATSFPTKYTLEAHARLCASNFINCTYTRRAIYKHQRSLLCQLRSRDADM